MRLCGDFTLLFFIFSSILLIKGEDSDTDTKSENTAKQKISITGLENDIDDPLDTVVHESQELKNTQPLCVIGVKCRKRREANVIKREVKTHHHAKTRPFEESKTHHHAKTPPLEESNTHHHAKNPYFEESKTHHHANNPSFEESKTHHHANNPSFEGANKLNVYKKAIEELYRLLNMKAKEGKSKDLLHKVIKYAKLHPNPKYKKVVHKITKDIKNERRDEKHAIKDLKSLKNILSKLRHNYKLPPLLDEKLPEIHPNASEHVGNDTTPAPKTGNLAVTAKTISDLLSAIAKILDVSSSRIVQKQNTEQSVNSINGQQVPMTGMQYPLPSNSQSENYPPQMMTPSGQSQFPLGQQGGNYYPPQYPMNGMQYTLPMSPQSGNYPAIMPMPVKGMLYSLQNSPQMQSQSYGFQPEVHMPEIQLPLNHGTQSGGSIFQGPILSNLRNSLHKGSLPMKSVSDRLGKIIKLLRSGDINSYNKALELLAMETYNLKYVPSGSLKWKTYLTIKLILDSKLSEAEAMLRNLSEEIHQGGDSSIDAIFGKHTGSSINKNKGFSEWGQWSPCNAECGVGTQSRWRFCQMPTQCTGKSVEKRPCEAKECRQL